MTELGAQLQADDPLRREPVLPPDDVERMRHVVLAAGRSESPRLAPGGLGLGFVLACSLSAVVAAGFWMVRQGAPEEQPPVARAGSDTFGAPNGRRQVQFATPGGTRVIWVLETTSN